MAVEAPLILYAIDLSGYCAKVRIALARKGLAYEAREPPGGYGSAAYRELKDLGYDHQRTVMLGSDVPAHVSMAGVHRVAALVKRWILGTHHGSVQPAHLDAYLDEFVFRFNRRTSASRGMLFYRLLQQAVITDPVTYDDVVRPLPKSAKPS